MRALRFYKISPGGNPTILVLDAVAPENRAPFARALLDAQHLQAEQVGYLNLDVQPARLDMMGGEFCGNACRAAAAVMVREGRGLVREDGEWRGVLSVSGVERPLVVRVLSDGADCWVEMPLPEGEAVAEVAPGIGLVRVPGIAHLCLDERAHPVPADFVRIAQDLRQRFGLTGEDAAGCVWYRGDAAACAIQPVVWVRSTDSTYYESGCGSGSLAVALWLGRGQNLPTATTVRQPSGGEIGVRVTVDESGPRAWIHGPVTLVARGETWV